MKLAIPVNKNNEVDGHFGHCEMYTVVTLNDKNEIIDTDTITSPKGCGCKSDIAKMLAAQGVANMLVGGIGTGAMNKLNEAGIEVVRGCSGNVEELAVNFASGKIADNGSNCEHHHHHEHHNGECEHL
ncbi:MAG: NifB/NifX family molybdenum-iron cluster-binding protein [Dysgonamonadaceae bacterium]